MYEAKREPSQLDKPDVIYSKRKDKNEERVINQTSMKMCICQYEHVNC